MTALARTFSCDRSAPRVKAKESLWHVVQAKSGLGLTLLTHVNQY